MLRYLTEIMKHNKYSAAALRVLVLTLTSVSLISCASWYRQDQDSSTTDCKNKNAEGVCFPDKDRSWLETTSGKYINTQNVESMRSGMTKDEVRETIGYPHFKEGFFGVTEWDYLFKFRTAPTGNNFVNCQYKVKFDDNYRVKSMHWLEPNCPIQTKTALPVIVREVPAKQAQETISIDTDALFVFDKAELNDVQSSGKVKLDNLLNLLRNNYSSIEWLFITGHTDPLGGEAYNQKLSETRANTVRNYLIRNGFPVNTIIAKGVAAEQMVKQCPTNLSIPELIACHQANRRVTVEVRGVRK